jgi:hypothetical protein
MQSIDLDPLVDRRERLSLWERRIGSHSNASERKRQANEFMRSGLAQYDESEPIPFFCECRRDACYQPVWLAKAEYDRRRRRPDRALFAGEHDAADMTLGHRPVSRELTNADDRAVGVIGEREDP